MKKRWLLAAILMAGLIALGISAPWWLSPVLTFAGANSTTIDGLTGLMQLVLWAGAAVVALWGWLTGRKKPPAATQPTAARYNASQKAGGIQQQGRGNTAADQKSIAVGRDVYGDVIYVTDSVDFWERLGKQRPPADLTAATNSYLRLLVDRYRYLDFKGMGVSDRIPLRLPLAEMYVPLKARIEMPEGETWSRKLPLAGRAMSEEEVSAIGQRLSEPQPVLELLEKHPGLIILGDPGAGKTTFLKYLVVQLAGGQGDGLGLGNRLPILLPLSAYANALADKEIALDRFIAGYYQDLGVDLPLEAMLAEALKQGGALILLDGLDEVKNLADRQTVVKRVVDFFNYRQQQGNKFILTSRIVGYRDVRPTCEGLAECTLVDFNDDEIGEFIQKWTLALEKAARGDTASATLAAREEQADLLAAVERNPGVRTLAANPLLLTILALMKRQGVTLPERRVELYDQYIKTLLKTWNLARGLGRSTSRDLDVIETVRLLAPLALWMHRTSPGVGLVKREPLYRELVKICRERELPEPEIAAKRLLQDVREHAGLLLERGAGTYGFIHLTFQEYLAAVAIAQKGQQNVDRVVEELAAHIADDNWHEVALLTIGHMGISQQLDAVAGEVVTRLIKRSPGQPGQAVVLAGEAVVDSLPGGVDVKTCRYVQQVLTKTLTADRRVTPVLRAAAGRTLARLGDTRAGVALRPDGLPDIEWCGVPSGPFLMGNDEKTDPEADSDEQPQHTVNLPGYLISRYPVTNAQFTAFVQAGGYQKAAYWEEALGQGFWQPGQVQDVRYYLDDKSDLQKEVRGWRNQPVYFGEPFNLVNHPVVGISWYEGLAYCRWLEEQLAGSNRLKLLQEQLLGLNSRPVQGVRVRLPSEAEWEKAGRGSDGQKYPWGNEPDPNLANYEDTKIGVTSAVGCFAGGASPYGVEEMSGNVWEWTRSLWRPDSNRPIFPYPYDAADGREDLGAGTNVHRVVRGGAFDDGERSVRCACRFRFDPDLRDLSLGFRVVVSPLF